MRNFPLSDDRSNTSYFERIPEKLVLEGYRYWIAGYSTGSIRPWEACWNLYAVQLGAIDGRKAMAELSNMVRVLRRCANCPLNHFPYGSHHICFQEALAMGLVAGYQNEDTQTVKLCVDQLTCPLKTTEFEAAANSYANTLFVLQQVMRPIPTHVIEDLIARNGHTANVLH